MCVHHRAALDSLAARAPLVEVGAGVGYWAKLLRARGVRVDAYDRLPPSPGNEDSNEYHGRTPCVSRVDIGGPEVAAAQPRSTLFLCYPPPDDPMAVDCLHQYRWETGAAHLKALSCLLIVTGCLLTRLE
jgi:hypothetical protein